MSRQNVAAANFDVDLDQWHHERLDWLERVRQPIVALPTEYPNGYHVPDHHHSRGQLLYAPTGVVLVQTQIGRWMVPPGHAMWIPAGVRHSVDMLGSIVMRSIYVSPDAIDGLPPTVRVVKVTELMRSLIAEAVLLPVDTPLEGRAGLLFSLLLHEIPNLPVMPLGLPFPSDARLVSLCRRFIAAPSPHATIDEWADMSGMSRRTFTRLFHRQTGLSLSTWRQQACLFAALPRLAAGEPITGVAFDLGYDSVPAFTTMFKRMLGTSPRNYLRGAREPAQTA
jgi:AraC-like DNA-binding protein/mannose-6-phosphate isomerase-like protein (cupin superfamily)